MLTIKIVVFTKLNSWRYTISTMWWDHLVISESISYSKKWKELLCFYQTVILWIITNLWKKLARYIEIDIFCNCVGNNPCKSFRFTRTKTQITRSVRVGCTHITISFLSNLWEFSVQRLQILDNFLLGWLFCPSCHRGLTVQEILMLRLQTHSYNFSSVDQLSRYMKMLTKDGKAYNRYQYHEWRKMNEIKLAYS